MPEKCKKNAPDQKVRIRKFVYLAVVATKILIIQRLEKMSKRGTVTERFPDQKNFRRQHTQQ